VCYETAKQVCDLEKIHLHKVLCSIDTRAHDCCLRCLGVQLGRLLESEHGSCVSLERLECWYREFGELITVRGSHKGLQTLFRRWYALEGIGALMSNVPGRVDHLPRNGGIDNLLIFRVSIAFQVDCSKWNQVLRWI